MTYQKQVSIIEEMQSKGFNVCNCGNCGGIILLNEETKPKMEDDSEGIYCPHCKVEMAYSDCPDYYYEGMPELNKERDSNM